MVPVWLKRYRLLVFAYGVGICLGVREYVLSRRGETMGGPGSCQASAASCFSTYAKNAGLSGDSIFWTRHSQMTDVLTRVNPDDPDTDFLRAMQSLQEGDEESFEAYLEESLAAGVKHNEFLLQYYAQYLLNHGEDWTKVNWAVNRWRENHPFSAETLTLPLASGPTTQGDADFLRTRLVRIPWVSDAFVESREVNGERYWQVQLAFLPGREVDVREAVAAVTLLSLPPEERARVDVKCYTLQDCRALPRGRR